MSIYRFLQKEWEGYEFRKYRCTGKNCGFEVEGLWNLQIECPNKKCKGTVTGRKKIPNKRFIKQTIKHIEDHRGGFNSALPARIRTISPSLRRELDELE